MRITFPHLGNLYIPVKAVLDDLEIDYIIPPFNNREALEIGTRYSPELACLPLKINIGNYIQARAEGADTVLMAGGCGPCRFGYYCEIQREILHDAGYDMDMITLEMNDGDVGEFIRRVRKLTAGANIFKLLKAVKNVTEISVMVDELERLCFSLRPREIRRGETDRIYKGFREDIRNIKGSGEIRKYIKLTCDRLREIEFDKNAKPLKIGIVGEIYTTIDTGTSFNIQEKLGGMGAEVHREVTVSGWIIEHILKKALHLPRDLRYAEAAKKYLGKMIGGHAQETVGNTVLFAGEGYDGVIQIYPLSCMPEIVAQSILPTVEEELDIPILTLIIDEMTGEAGYLTRIEAFMDLLKRRRDRGDAFVFGY